MKDKTLFKATLPYLKERYKEDMLNRTKHKQFLLLAQEKDRKKTNYGVVRKIPKQQLKEAERLYLPKLADWIFLGFLIVGMTFLNLMKPKLISLFFAIFGIGGVAYGLIIAITSNLDVDPPRSRSLQNLWDKGNFKQSLSNILNTLGQWWMAAAGIYGLTGLAVTGIPFQENHGTMAALGCIFTFLFYKTRW